MTAPGVFPWPLGRLATSQARILIAPRVEEALAEIRASGPRDAPARRMIAVEFDCLPPVQAQIDHILGELARMALALWPHWYRGSLPEELVQDTRSGPPLPSLTSRAEADRLPADREERSVAWFRSAGRLCRSGRLPLPSRFPAAIQARQLRLAIDPGEVLLVLALLDTSAAPSCLLGLSRCAEWLARESAAPVLVLVPEPLAQRSELDGINFEAIRWSFPPPPSRSSSFRETIHHIGPILGQPHPLSPGEQLLAHRLAQDDALGARFAFNQRVRTCFETDYLVDLLCADARLVVEIDGYEFHSTRQAFALDRRRDFELVVSGYLVIRLPHDEVMEDVERAIDKIRDLVRFRSVSLQETRAQP